ECPVEALVDQDDNPTGEDTYYVYADKCDEWVGHNDAPACADAWPTEGCRVWDEAGSGSIEKEDRGTPGTPDVV
ncbi:ferredoxin, partial [Aliarcobacter butzleri]|uniref:ferredoxin n=1 Tax=Aliarcobacter butzleri TaxID=28197 RepID=UPI003AF5720A